MSVERPNVVPVVPDIYNIDFAQLYRLGNKTAPSEPPPPYIISKEPEEDSNSEGEK